MQSRPAPSRPVLAPAVWVTRALPDAHATAARLAALSLEAVVESVIVRRALPFDPAAAGEARALAFTSAAGVRAFAAAWPARDLPVFAVGAATAQAARDCGWREVTSADGDVEALDRLLARAAPAGPVLAPGARTPAGVLANARRLAVYETAPLHGPWPQAAAACAAGRLAAVLVQSPSAARALAPHAAAFASGAPAWLAASAACAAPLLEAGAPTVRVAEAPTEAALLHLLAPRDPDAPPWQAAPPRL